MQDLIGQALGNRLILLTTSKCLYGPVNSKTLMYQQSICFRWPYNHTKTPSQYTLADCYLFVVGYTSSCRSAILRSLIAYLLLEFITYFHCHFGVLAIQSPGLKIAINSSQLSNSWSKLSSWRTVHPSFICVNFPMYIRNKNRK